MKTTIRDVAREAGVSIASVSNALNGKKKVSDETQARIEEAVKRLGYVADPTASSLKSGSSHIIGLIVPSIDSAFFPAVIAGLQSTLERRGYIINFYATDFVAENEKKYLSALLASKVSGIIIDSVSTSRAFLSSLSGLSSAKRRIPVIALERDLTEFGLTSVFTDSFAGGRLAAEHLLSMGVRHPAHISGRASAPWSHDRLDGFCSVLSEAGIALPSELIESGDFTLDGGYSAASRLMARDGSIDGIFAANDLSAVGAMRALLDVGRRIPEDIALVGFDNTYITSLTTPTVSTVEIPKDKFGSLVGEAVIRAIEGSGAVERIELAARLIERASSMRV